jgi:HK97 family phage portal protein
MLGLRVRHDDPTDELRAGGLTAWGDWTPSGSRSWSGVPISAVSSLQLLAVYGSVRLISDSISTLPVDVYRESDGEKIEVPAPTWLTKPTPSLGFPEWCSQVLSSLLLSGNAYIAVMRNSAGAIVELLPIDPLNVEVVRPSMASQVIYLIGGRQFTGELIHIKGLMLPGADVGLSPIEAARQSIGLGLSAQQYGSQFFDSEGNMPGVIEIPGRAVPEQMASMAKAWAKKRNRSNKGLPGVLEGGATWKPTGVTNEQAQFLATRKFTAAEIAGQMFLVDPSDLGIPVEGTSLTYANLEQRNARRVQVTLLPWMVRIEAAISALLAKPRFMRFNVDGLLRGDMAARYSSYAVGIQNGFLLPNEARDLEDLLPLPDSPTSPEDATEIED